MAFSNMRHPAKRFALIFGIIYTILGLLGFVPGLVTEPEMAGDLAADTAHGRLFDIFPVNLWHNLVHLAVGIWGIAAAQRLDASVLFARANAVLFGLLVILGLIPATNTLGGVVPIYGNDIWLHAINTAVAGYFGFGPPAHAEPTPGTPDTGHR